MKNWLEIDPARIQHGITNNQGKVKGLRIPNTEQGISK